MRSAASSAQMAVDDMELDILRIQEDERKLRRREADNKQQLQSETDPEKRKDLDHDLYAAKSRIADLMSELKECHNEIAALRNNRDVHGARVDDIARQIELAERSAEAANAAAEPKLTGIKETFRADHAKSVELTTDVAQRWEALVEKAASGDQLTDVIELLELRLDASDAAVTAANIEVRVAGGAGYASSSSTSRRYREASFIPVQSPSEAQLRFQLEQARAKIA